MNADPKTALVMTGLTTAFLTLTATFLAELWGRSVRPVQLLAVDASFTNMATVRLSAAELIRTGGDASGLDCYACHDRNKPVQLHFDAAGHSVLPKEHKDIVMQHGRNNRNDHCFLCHDPKNLEVLRAHEGQAFKLTESSRLCGSCHGPTYRDWESGIHGRTVGYWDRKRGATVRSDCTSCHDPHTPAFPSIKPGPGPHPLHPKPAAAAATTKGH